MSRNSHKSKREFCPVLEHVDVNVDVKTLYYMTSSVSGQDEPNRAL